MIDYKIVSDAIGTNYMDGWEIHKYPEVHIPPLEVNEETKAALHEPDGGLLHMAMKLAELQRLLRSLAEDGATSSRDFGRGVTYAVHAIEEIL